MAGPGLAQGRSDTPPVEYQVKAAYLYNFAKFIEWPTNAFASATSEVTIGVVADERVAVTIERVLADKQVLGHPVGVRRLPGLNSDHAASCHILFLTQSAKEAGPDEFARLASRPVLTVGESADFLARGGIMNFVLTNATVRLQLNLKSAEKAGLKVSSKLASVAQLVNPGDAP